MTTNQQPQARTVETYRQQLDRLARAMASPNCEKVVAPDLPRGDRLDRVKMFVDGNLDKRLDKLRTELEFVAGAFKDFEDIVVEYIRYQPLAAMATSATDSDEFLKWLTSARQLSPSQQDYIACFTAQQTVERLGAKQRLAHIRFHDMWTLTSQMVPELDNNVLLQVYINPIRTWTRFFTSELLDEEASPPADVVVFAVGTEIATAVLEMEGIALLNELAHIEPCSLATWSALSKHSDRDGILTMTRELAELGLVALG